VEVLLFDQLKLPPVKKSAKTGKRSTDNEVLTQLSKVHPVPGLIIQYRELSKLLSTYLEPLPNEVDGRTGRVHTCYSQTITATGRLSSSMPNLQNIPVGAGFGHRVRDAFVAKPGHVFLSADYSQIELRVLAEFSKDPGLRDAFTHNKDIHCQTAAQIFEVEEKAVTNAQRQVGKKINFSIMYGLTPFGLSKDLDIPPKQAKVYIDNYFAQYPGVRDWMERVIEQAKIDGFVSTLLGRRRYVPGLHERNRHVQDAERRVAINTPIQGTTADLMKLAMLSIEGALRDKNLQTRQLLQIHDELLLEVPEAELEAVKVLVEQCMDNVVTGWRVPLEVSLREGGTWGEASK
jgi:DNA polymerase-1